MEIKMEQTFKIDLEGISPTQLGFICYALEEALPKAKEQEEYGNFFNLGNEVYCSLPYKDAKAILDKIKQLCTRDEMQGKMNVNPEVFRV